MDNIFAAKKAFKAAFRHKFQGAEILKVNLICD